MIDALDGATGFRHEFQSSPLRNVLHGEWKRVRLLFLRLVAMVRAFDPAVEDVRLTPSHRQHRPLGERAVPHYFRLTPGIRERWQPRLCCTADRLWSYGDPGGPGMVSAPQGQSPSSDSEFLDGEPEPFACVQDAP